MQQKLLQKEQYKKTVEATCDLIRNQIADKITSVSKNLQQSCTHKIMKLLMNPKHQKKETYSRKKATNY